jgi:hypothetical protein
VLEAFSMAKIHEELVVIKISSLHKEGEAVAPILSDETVSNLEAVVQQLVGEVAIVEIIKE